MTFDVRRKTLIHEKRLEAIANDVIWRKLRRDVSLPRYREFSLDERALVYDTFYSRKYQ